MANSYIKKLRLGLQAAGLAFQQSMITSDLLGNDDFTDPSVRDLRYKLNWALYENTAYNDIHSWAVAFKTVKGLYKYIRGVYNPVGRLSDFWASHMWTGQIDKDLGDGDKKHSAIPLIFHKKEQTDPIKTSLRHFIREANINSMKSLIPLWGSTLGDVFYALRKDAEGKRIYGKMIHPSTVVEVEKNDLGEIISYRIEETVLDPESNYEKECLYAETATLVRDNLGDYHTEYKTYKNEVPYAWKDNGISEWTTKYPFVPLVHFKHQDIGLDFGWSEFHKQTDKILNLDDVASNLSDFIRLSVNAPWLLSGVKRPSNNKFPTAAPSKKSPTPLKQEMRILYAGLNSTAHPLIVDMDMEGTAKFMSSVIEELEKDLPELSLDMWNIEGNKGSARALRAARQRTEKKGEIRRAGYDRNMESLFKMALVMGSMNDYPEYKSIPQTVRELDFSIEGDRPLFIEDALETAELDKTFWEGASFAIKSGLPLPVWLEEQGWTPEQIKKVTDSEEYKQKLALQSLALNQRETNPDNGKGGGEKSDRFSNKGDKSISLNNKP
jgi:hypothetical protein